MTDLANESSRGLFDMKERSISTQHLRTNAEIELETFKGTKCMIISLEITERNFVSLSGITLVHHRINGRHCDNPTLQKVNVSFDEQENMRASAFSLLCEDIITVCLGEKKEREKESNC